MNKKKLGTTLAVVGTAAAVLLTGTYAWQSANQEAMNVASGIVNPGGRLHDDFNGTDKKVYVENFGNQNIYARIRLNEYFEIGVSAGQNFESADRNVTKITGDDVYYDDLQTWPVRYYDVDNATEPYWNIEYGTGTVKYMPTFNLNKDSLEADINGTYFYDDGSDETTDDRYKDFIDYSLAENETKIADEIFDADTDTIDQYKDGSGVENVNYSINADQTHTVAKSLEACVKSMNDWNSMTEEEQNDTACWIYDSDGWAYWSKAIEPGTATGSLLNKISVKNVEDNWFYALNATAQFITADDMGQNDNTGFYDDTKGSAPSDDALNLLESIGVNTTEEETDDTEDPYGFSHLLIGYNHEDIQSTTYIDKAYAMPGDVIPFSAVAYDNSNGTLLMDDTNTVWTINALEGEIDEGTTISDDGVLTISSNQSPLSVIEVTVSYTDKYNTEYTKTHNVLISNEDITFTAEIEHADTYTVDTPYQVTVSASTTSGTSVPMVWSYDTFPTNYEENLSAHISETGEFVADVAGEYTINIWAEYMGTKHATVYVTVE